jgi:hypothetical protein
VERVSHLGMAFHVLSSREPQLLKLKPSKLKP